jgi:hypothetical protein
MTRPTRVGRARVHVHVDTTCSTLHLPALYSWHVHNMFMISSGELIERPQGHEQPVPLVREHQKHEVVRPHPIRAHRVHIRTSVGTHPGHGAVGKPQTHTAAHGARLERTRSRAVSRQDETRVVGSRPRHRCALRPSMRGGGALRWHWNTAGHSCVDTKGSIG